MLHPTTPPESAPCTTALPSHQVPGQKKADRKTHNSDRGRETGTHREIKIKTKWERCREKNTY